MTVVSGLVMDTLCWVERTESLEPERLEFKSQLYASRTLLMVTFPVGGNSTYVAQLFVRIK